jgi:putative DNA primase/helicase
MTLHTAMLDACRAVGIKPPRRALIPGRWTPTDTEGRNGKGDGRVMLDEDGRGGVAWNHQTQQHQRFRATGLDGTPIPMPKVDPEKERQHGMEEAQVVETCQRILQACRQAPHPYLARKGFPDEPALVCDDPRMFVPAGPFGEAMACAMPALDGPALIVPGRIDGQVTTLQFINTAGEKRTLRGSIMGGASHRIAMGRETWVAEGIATALSVRAALRFLGRSATVLTAFAANNVARVAGGILGAIIAADHDAPNPHLTGLGAGEYYARRSGRAWIMPPVQGEDFNDWHQREGLRAVAVHLREVTQS